MTERSAKARLLHCKKAAKYIHETILERGDIKYRSFDDINMEELRTWTEELLQCVHELNAYRNIANNKE